MAAPESNSLRRELRNLKVLQGPLQKCDFDSFPGTPQEAFQRWLHEAVAAGVKEPHAMTVSTVDDDGWPDARVLILKGVDHRGWHFAAKANSPKGRQADGNGHAALTFYWVDQGRQIRIRGKVLRLPRSECDADFDSRPLSSKISALSSKQSEVLEDEGHLRQALEHTRSIVKTGEDVRSLEWIVYAVEPAIVEFWQGAADRLHQRLQYKMKAGEQVWEKSLLWP